MNKIADTLGRNRLAREIEPEEVIEVIRPIYERGKRAMADHVRSYIRSAYSWGMKSEHDYRNASPRRFRLIYNPPPASRPNPRMSGRAGWTKTSSCGSIVGSNVRTPRCIRPTPAPSAS